MNNLALGISVVTLFTLNAAVANAASAEAPQSCELRPVMIENFDEETAPNRRIESISPVRIGPARWIAHTPWNGDFGDARFADPHPNGPFSMKDGILSITASKDRDGRWTSGLIAAADQRNHPGSTVPQPERIGRGRRDPRARCHSLDSTTSGISRSVRVT